MALNDGIFDYSHLLVSIYILTMEDATAFLAILSGIQ